LLLIEQMPYHSNKNTSKKAKNDLLYCVIESSDGARIISVDEANTFMSNLSDDRRPFVQVHFAGTLEAAEQLQRSIELRSVASNG
jgi:hypothetical protein